jgi:hypothetical protein
MTMQHESHPHDERLAALAGADQEAAGDRALREHVAGCDQCRTAVDDLSRLRSALAELPDLRPSRPLRLVPPVAEPVAPRRGPLGLLRRLSAPALAAGIVLILVGTVGGSGILEGLAGMGGAASAPMFQNVGDDLGAEAEPGASSAEESAAASDSALNPDVAGGGYSASPGTIRGQASGESPTPKRAPAGEEPTDEGRDGDTSELTATADPFDGRLPWFLMLGAGIVLASSALLLRFTVQPRAG